jgi:tripartite-type tricarboxylate transporter receptor subunit TctC
MTRPISIVPPSILGAVASVLLVCPALAQSWPTRPVTMVVPAAAGSSIDVIARVLSPGLSKQLGRQVIVENIGGAGGMTASARVAKAAPDGYQFVLGHSGTHAINQTLFKKPLYDAAADFAPVALIAELPIVLIARQNFPAANLKEFIAYAKANQAKMQYGSAGAGTTVHLACELLNAAIGIKITHIPYRGGGPAMQDLIAGLIDYQCVTTAAALPQIEGKIVKPVAILMKGRSPTLPELPSAHEQGLTDFEAVNWNAFFFPRGTPAPIIQRLNQATFATINTPSVQTKLQDDGAMVPAPERRSSEYLKEFVRSEIDKWEATIKASGLSAE